MGKFDKVCTREQRCALYWFKKNGVPTRVLANHFGVGVKTITKYNDSFPDNFADVKREYAEVGDSVFKARHVSNAYAEAIQALTVRMEAERERRVDAHNAGQIRQSKIRAALREQGIDPKLLDVPDWTEAELAEMAPGRAADIRQSMETAKHARRVASSIRVN